MRLKLRSFLLTSALTFAPSFASATTISGLYIDGGAGYNEVQDQHVHANTPANGDAVPKFTIHHGTGYTGFGAIGYGFGNGLRVEAEGLYNSSNYHYTAQAPEESRQELVQIINGVQGNGVQENALEKKEGIVDVLPFRDLIGGQNAAKQTWQALKQINSGGTVPSTFNGGEGTNNGSTLDIPTGCDKSYSWCGAFGGAPVVVIQKIDELPNWATPTQLNKNGDFGSGNGPNGAWNSGAASYPSSSSGQNNTSMTQCSDCYYISTLTPQQALQLEQDNTSSWLDNGTLPPLSQQTMTIPSAIGTGANTTQVPVEGPPVLENPQNGDITNTGGGSTYLSGNDPYVGNQTQTLEANYMQQVMDDLSNADHGKGLSQGYYYFQGNLANPNNPNASSGQVFENYPNQQGYDGMINKIFNHDYYPKINAENPGEYGYPEPTPLPTCTNGNCTLNITPKWMYSSTAWPESSSSGTSFWPNTQAGIGVINVPANTENSESSTLFTEDREIEPEDGYKVALTRAAVLLRAFPTSLDPVACFTCGKGSDHRQDDTPGMRYPNIKNEHSSEPDETTNSGSGSPSDNSNSTTGVGGIPSPSGTSGNNSGTSAHNTPPASIPFSTSMTMRTVRYHGRDQSYGGFANVLYDFDLERLFGLRSIVTPFVGGGAGYLWQRYDSTGPVAAAAITGVHGGFAWQGIAGVAFDTGIRGLQITAQYRMIGQPGSFYNGSFNYGTEGGHANFDQRFNHQFIVGFRYAFQNQPIHHIQPPAVRPIVAAAPAPVPARSYLVFFDWNQYALTSRARQIVVEAAHATSYVHTTRINVNGYTDSSAAPGAVGKRYNLALSVKRAKSVEAELIRNGVPASEIVIRGYGDTNPLVPTAPNTREPQNRRVEIILHA